MPAWRALRMAIQLRGARCWLGRYSGSLESGKQADFIAIDLNCPSMLPVYTYPMRNMIPNLVYSARGCEVSLVAVDGEVIMQDGKFTRSMQTSIWPPFPSTPTESASGRRKNF